MSIQLMAAIWEYGPNNPTQRFVLLSLADYADADGSCFPSYKRTAQRCAINRNTAIRTIKSLEADGWLTVEQQVRSNGSYTSNRIYINLDRLLPGGAGSPGDARAGVEMVAQDHQGGGTESLPGGAGSPGWSHRITRVVAQDHQGGGTESPLDPSIYPLNDPSGDPGREEERGANAPTPLVPVDSFRPISDELKAQKARRNIRDPEPELISTAPEALRLLARLSGYWPGTDVADALAARLGAAPDEAALARAVELWRLSGNKPTNWLGIIDWYDELRRAPDWTPQTRFKPRQNGAAAPALSPAEQAADRYVKAKRAVLGDLP